jgi:hypothetical protein
MVDAWALTSGSQNPAIRSGAKPSAARVVA